MVALAQKDVSQGVVALATAMSAAKEDLLYNAVKAKIIKYYLPYMNKYINKFLSSMDFFAQFTLDEDFNEKINQLKDEELPEGNLTFEKMEAYIFEHIDTVNVDQLRMATGMSKYAFYMGFERYFGKTPKEVIFEMKQAVAQQKRKEFLTYHHPKQK